MKKIVYHIVLADALFLRSDENLWRQAVARYFSAVTSVAQSKADSPVRPNLTLTGLVKTVLCYR